MWQLGLTSSESYPERPGVPNCVYYMRTGFCGYGIRCRYNHPRDRAAVNPCSLSLFSLQSVNELIYVLNMKLSAVAALLQQEYRPF